MVEAVVVVVVKEGMEEEEEEERVKLMIMKEVREVMQGIQCSGDGDDDGVVVTT